MIFQIVIPANAGIQRLQRDFSDRHSRERGLCFTSAQPNIQRLCPARLHALAHERHWMFGCAEVKQSPRSRE
ncbi:MAG: hypothetical protein JF591_17355 [Lysobacter sp.]|nr:hypothetical protein [Lysobacter sp.]